MVAKSQGNSWAEVFEPDEAFFFPSYLARTMPALQGLGFRALGVKGFKWLIGKRVVAGMKHHHGLLYDPGGFLTWAPKPYFNYEACSNKTQKKHPQA